MSNLNQANPPLFAVVLNDEEQYSIWPAAKPLPVGWTQTGTPDTKEACLGRIKELWTDMRPLSLRRQMAAPPR